MEDGAKQHLREWLIAQIDSGRYEGLCWEHEDRSMFRIPWKHAAKKDYNQREDAALFKAWAVYKGKYREGRDRADPTMWKTRLRCALNKSTDFQEVPERNQLDISEPYKVYRIQPDAGCTRPVESLRIKEEVIIPDKMSPPCPEVLDVQRHFENQPVKVNEEEKASSEDPMKEHLYCELKEEKPLTPQPAAVSFLSLGHTKVADFRLQVSLYYLGQTIMEVTTTSGPDGCFLLWGQAPVGNEQIYGRCAAQQISFPSPEHASLPPGVADAMNRLFVHLERGVLVWVAPDGVFIKRFCQGRVYWSGPLARHTDRPNKLERDKTFKLLDVPRFISEMQRSSQGKGPAPAHEIQLCFGEEYPDPQVPKTRKLIMAKVVPLFALELLQKVKLGESEGRAGGPGGSEEGAKME